MEHKLREENNHNLEDKLSPRRRMSVTLSKRMSSTPRTRSMTNDKHDLRDKDNDERR